MIGWKRPPRFDAAALVCSTLLIGLLLLIVARDYPLVGHDHRYYIPRLLDTLLHHEANGPFAIQWYTPTFGGGLPAFPNPQHLQHSVLQVLTSVVNPWLAILATTAAASYAGFYAFQRFLERRVGVTGPSSTLGAVLFVGNGFYIEHLIVGHVGFQLFPLAAVMLYALTDTDRRALTNACTIALVVAAMLYHAGVYLIILSALSLSIMVPVLWILHPHDVDARRIGATALAALVLAGVIGASKVHAVLAFMRHFPREIDEPYTAGLIQGLVGLLAQLSAAMSLAPIFTVLDIELSSITAGLSRLTGASPRFGIWELDTSVSPVVWIVLGAAIVKGLVGVRLRGRPHIERRQLLAWSAALVVTWLLIEATLARGLVYPLLKPLPILRSLHVNTRVASTFIMPLTMLAAVIVHRRYGNTRHIGVMAALLCLALISPSAYLLFPAAMQQRSFDVTSSIDAYSRIRAGESFAVSRIADVEDADALASGTSSYRPYEPLFGYASEDFVPATVPGDVRQVRDGAFNMHHPTGFVFDEVNGVHPFDRIPQDDEAGLEALVTRGRPAWSIPPLQRTLNWASLIAVGVALAGALAPGARTTTMRPSAERPRPRH